MSIFLLQWRKPRHGQVSDSLTSQSQGVAELGFETLWSLGSLPPCLSETKQL